MQRSAWYISPFGVKRAVWDFCSVCGLDVVKKSGIENFTHFTAWLQYIQGRQITHHF